MHSEPVFVDLLRSPGIDPSLVVRYDNPICRTGPPGYIARWNRFLGSIKVYKCGLSFQKNGRKVLYHHLELISTVPQSGISIVKKQSHKYPECSDFLSGGKGSLQEMVMRCTTGGNMN